jgi:hypothetical protein
MCYDDTEQIILQNEAKLEYERLKKMIEAKDPDVFEQMLNVKALLDRLINWGRKILIDDEFRLLYKNYLIENQKNHGKI